MYISLTHKNPTGVTPIVFDKFGHKVEPLLDQNLVAKFHRVTRLNLRQGMQGILTNLTANGSVTEFVAIPSEVSSHGLWTKCTQLWPPAYNEEYMLWKGFYHEFST